MNIFNTFFILVLFTGCFKKDQPEKNPKIKAELKAEINPRIQVIQEAESKTSPPLSLLTKEQREAIYFAASLEKEALKVLTKNPSFSEITLFSVLSYAVEIQSGVKKSASNQMDCSRFRFLSVSDIPKSIKIYKTCQRPQSLIAEINWDLDPSHMKVTFFIKEWVSVLGLTATLTGQDIRCALDTELKKLARFTCDGWTRTLGPTEELRLKTFLFERKSSKQFILKGGFYTDLIERKKIEIVVPLDGKITRFEKEIEVHDEFAEKPPEVAAKVPEVSTKSIQPEARLMIPPSQNNETSENPMGANEEKLPQEDHPPLGDQHLNNGGVPTSRPGR